MGPQTLGSRSHRSGGRRGSSARPGRTHVDTPGSSGRTRERAASVAYAGSAALSRSHASSGRTRRARGARAPLVPGGGRNAVAAHVVGRQVGHDSLQVGPYEASPRRLRPIEHATDQMRATMTLGNRCSTADRTRSAREPSQPPTVRRERAFGARETRTRVASLPVSGPGCRPVRTACVAVIEVSPTVRSPSLRRAASSSFSAFVSARPA